MITTSFLHVHIVYCRSLQLRMTWQLHATLKLGGSCTFDVYVSLDIWRGLLSSPTSWTFHRILVSFFSSLFVLVVLVFVLVSHQLWWGKSHYMGLYKAGTCSCFGKLWWFELNPFCWSMLICFTNWISCMVMCRVGERSLRWWVQNQSLSSLSFPNFYSLISFPSLSSSSSRSTSKAIT